MNQYQIPQRKQSHQAAKHFDTSSANAKQIFSNTNVLTGISQSAVGLNNSYRTSKQTTTKGKRFITN